MLFSSFPECLTDTINIISPSIFEKCISNIRSIGSYYDYKVDCNNIIKVDIPESVLPTQIEMQRIEEMKQKK